MQLHFFFFTKQLNNLVFTCLVLDERWFLKEHGGVATVGCQMLQGYTRVRWWPAPKIPKVLQIDRQKNAVCSLPLCRAQCSQGLITSVC